MRRYEFGQISHAWVEICRKIMQNLRMCTTWTRSKFGISLTFLTLPREPTASFFRHLSLGKFRLPITGKVENESRNNGNSSLKVTTCSTEAYGWRFITSHGMSPIRSSLTMVNVCSYKKKPKTTPFWIS